MIVDSTYDRAKVEAFGRRLLADSHEAVLLADTLLRGLPFTGAAAAVFTAFCRLTAWEQAGVVDELRDALDQIVGDVFHKYVIAARKAEEE